MELVAWLAGEEHSDSPRCACPVLAPLVRAFNDLCDESSRREELLRPLAPLLVRSVTTRSGERRRAFALLDFALRHSTAAQFERTGANEHADDLRALPPVRTAEDARAAAAVLRNLSGTARLQSAQWRAAQWAATRAASGAAPERWIQGVAHIAKASGDWSGLSSAIRQSLKPESATTPARTRRHLRVDS